MVREIHISPVLNGFVCKVGCQTVVFTSRQSMLEGIDLYYERPEETERQMLSNPVNRTAEVPCAPPTGLCAGSEPCTQAAPELGQTRQLISRG